MRHGTRLQNPFLISTLFLLNILIASVANSLLGKDGWKLTLIAQYLNLPLTVGIIVILFKMRASYSMKRVDSAIGDYSYPVYLLHVQAGLVAVYLLPEHSKVVNQALNPKQLLLALLFTIVASGALIKVIDRNVNKIRRAVKQSISIQRNYSEGHNTFRKTGSW